MSRAYDPMMDANEYHWKRALLLRHGWAGAGNYWYAPVTRARRTLAGALFFARMGELARRTNEFNRWLAQIGIRARRAALAFCRALHRQGQLEGLKELRVLESPEAGRAGA